MALATYADLKTAVARWTSGTDSSTVATMSLTNRIDDLITLGEARIFREAKTKDTEASINTAMSNGVVAVPSDYMALKQAYVDGTPVQGLEPRSPDWIYSNYSVRASSGKPKFIARDQTNFIFGPYPDSGYTMIGTYYKKFPAFSTAVHALFTNNPDLYLFGCLAESTILLGNDSRIPLWEAKYTKILANVNGMDRTSETFRANIQMRIG